MAWWKRAKPGDRVVCIASQFAFGSATGPWGAHHHVKQGSVWTIAKIYPGDHFDDCLIESAWLALEGNDPSDLLQVEAFRPVEPRKADISVFTDMLRSDEREREASDQVSV
ncbi:hypothetical protein [Oceaniradius stylonematis]|uniref:hypothetical protein n=1 Tax=Oceaniradius stylonematis TaxID=2184161 RepID=UPI00273DAB1D|nr:hypothetical protein [Oceaniradius stylonematis]